ncbi:MAG: PilZ domain-containing protein [Sedimenticolaceae bacterium]
MPFDAPTMLSFSYAEGVQSSNLIDISLNGALVVTPKDWSGIVGDEIMLKVMLGDEEPHINIQTKISHHESG